MIIKNNKKIAISICISIAILISIIFSFSNITITKAETTGKEYWKYVYGSNGNKGTFYSYTLPNLSIFDNSGLNLSRANPLYHCDDRKNAPLEQLVVSIGTGSGFIIGEHEIMTAAHVLTDQKTKKIDKPIVKIPKSNPMNSTSISLSPVFATFPKDFYNEKEGNDYAILSVKEDLSDYGNAFLGLGVNNKLYSNNLYSIGYNYQSTPTQKISSGKITSIEDNIYKTNMPVYGGTSGGPLYCQYEFGVQGSTEASEKVQTYKTVIGITMVSLGYAVLGNNLDEFHSTGSIATRITPEILQFAYDNDFL